MSARNAKSNSEEKFIKLNSHQNISSYSVRKNEDITKLYTEYKNNIKQKINAKNLNRNGIEIQIQETFEKNTKIYLKKNMAKNLSALSYIEKSMDEKDDKAIKNRLNNIKFNIGKSCQNFLCSQISKENMKKSYENSYELLDNNNYLKKSKTNSNNVFEKNKKDNPISFSTEISFLKNEKNKKEINVKENSFKKGNKEGINRIIRNTCSNVKIFPTTILNNKIIYQKSENGNNTSIIRHNNSKIKKEKIVIDIADKKQKKNNENIEFVSIEELHFFLIGTLQKGKKFAFKLDKNCNF